MPRSASHLAARLRCIPQLLSSPPFACNYSCVAPESHRSNRSSDTRDGRWDPTAVPQPPSACALPALTVVVTSPPRASAGTPTPRLGLQRRAHNQHPPSSSPPRDATRRSYIAGRGLWRCSVERPSARSPSQVAVAGNNLSLSALLSLSPTHSLYGTKGGNGDKGEGHRLL